MKTVVEKHVNLCDCYTGDYRGTVHESFYQVSEGGWVRCRECGTVPRMIGHPNPEADIIKLRVYQELDSQIDRTYSEVHYVSEQATATDKEDNQDN